MIWLLGIVIGLFLIGHNTFLGLIVGAISWIIASYGFWKSHKVLKQYDRLLESYYQKFDEVLSKYRQRPTDEYPDQFARWRKMFNSSLSELENIRQEINQLAERINEGKRSFIPLVFGTTWPLLAVEDKRAMRDFYQLVRGMLDIKKEKQNA